MSTNSDDRSSPAERVDKAANKILFIGFLCNTDSSILKLKLGNGYRVKSMDEPAGIQHIAFAEKLPVDAIYERLTISDPCLNVAEKKFYTVNKVFDAKLKAVENSANVRPDLTELVISLIVLEQKLRIVRLFREGDIRMPLAHAFYVDANRKVERVLRGFQTNLFTSRVPFTLTEDELPKLQEFLKVTKLPFPKQFLRLAFSLFETSYTLRERALSFLCLIISMEVMYNTDTGKSVSKEVSKLCSLLFEHDASEREHVSASIREMYRKRVRMVHYGQTSSISEEDLMLLRKYVRESIKEMNRRGLDKGELLKSLG